VTPLSVAGFSAMRALSTPNDARRRRPPLDRRSGWICARRREGVLILEEVSTLCRRGANVLAELVAYAANSDAFHTNAPPGMVEEFAV